MLFRSEKLRDFTFSGHAFELGYKFMKDRLMELAGEFNEKRSLKEELPYLAALVCFSAFDIALHDAFGNVNKIPVYDTYNCEYMNNDLSYYLRSASDREFDFRGMYPQDFFVIPAAEILPAWHLVGGKDLLDASELTGGEPDDGYPVVLPDWIRTDGLTCLKVKLTGTDSEWDYTRQIGRAHV